MEKQRVNDAVVKLGNLIGKGRTFVVHRISGKIRELRRKNEQKFQTRIDRLLLEIAFLKTLTNSRSRKLISRRILLSEDNHTAKIESHETVPEERAFHRLCREKCIAEYVTKFREDNIDWKYWVPPLLEMWQKKQDLKKDRVKNKEGRPSVKEIAQKKKASQNINGENSTDKKDSDSDDESSEDQKGVMIRPKDSNKLKRTSSEHEDERPAKRANISVSEKDLSSKSKAQSKATTLSNHPLHNKTGNMATSSDESDNDNDESSFDEEEPGSDDADEEVVFNRKKIAQFANDHGDEESDEVDSEEIDESDEGNAQSGDNESETPQPFRPYAPKHTECSDSDDSDNSVADEDVDEESEEDDESEVEQMPDAKIVQRNETSGSNESDSDEDADSEDEEMEGNEDIDQTDGSDEHGSEESENEEEIRRKKQLLLGGLNRSKTKELEIDFSVQKKLQCVTKDMDDPAIRDKAVQQKAQIKKQQLQRKMHLKVESGARDDRDKTSDSDVSEDDVDNAADESDEGASFFLKEGEVAKEVPSKTVPKENAPGLNRRERRGHNAKKSFTDDNFGGDNEDNTGNCSRRDGFRKGGKFQNAFQKNGDLHSAAKSRNFDHGGRNEQPFRRRDSAPFNRDQRFNGKLRQGQSDHRGGGDPFRGRRSFGGTTNFKERGANGGFDNNFQSSVRNSGSAQATNRGPAGDMAGGRKSFGGFNRNANGGFGGRNNDRRDSFGGNQKGKDNWTPREDRGDFNRGRNDSNQSRGRFESQKQFQKEHPNPRGGNRAFDNGSGAPVQKGFQGGNQPHSASLNDRGQPGQSDEKLHPSWQAKKRMSASINQPFQGKKIVFADD